MNIRRSALLSCLLVAGAGLTAGTSVFAQDYVRTFDIPELEGIVVDGDAADWGTKGFHVDAMADPTGAVRNPADFDAAFRLGWSEAGLLVLVTVNDSAPFENDDPMMMWLNDSIELFVAPVWGAADYYQTILAPGRGAAHPELRQQFYDFRQNPSNGLQPVQAARTASDSGYVLETLLPWANLDLTPKRGDEVAFQIFVTDSDGEGDRFQVQWYPVSTAHNTTLMHRIRLAGKSSPALSARAFADYADLAYIRVRAYGAPDAAGKKVEVRDGGKAIGSAVFQVVDDRVSAELRLPLPEPGKPYGTMTLRVDRQPADLLIVPNADRMRAEFFMSLPEYVRDLDYGDERIGLESYVLESSTLPKYRLRNAAAADAALGAYTVRTTFYDKDYNVVTQADKPGRYGAVIEVLPENGPPLVRYRTLFRAPEGYTQDVWWSSAPASASPLPAALGIDPAVEAAHSPEIAQSFWFTYADATFSSLYPARLFAGLYEMKPDESSVYDAADLRDAQWWLRFNRKANGNDRVYTEPVVCPRVENDSAAPVLRPGTDVEAGMVEGTAAKLDALCKQWAADSDQGFAMCVARNGVVFLHQGYGMRDGAPMTTEMPSGLASITKLLSATLMMQLVDLGLVDLDDSVDKFLPELRGIQVKTPLTVRHLYTHTSGFTGHWGDDMRDLAYAIAPYYPYLEVGKQHMYNGVGYAIGGKIIEQISGETVPEFYRKHLLDPLGCTQTAVKGTYADALSVPMDIAKVGQMLLNRGAYGDKRFFSEETFSQMVPERLTRVLGENAGVVWGIGTISYPNEGLGKKTFGHSGGSGSQLRIDPENNLVVVTTRNGSGKNFGKYYPEFMKSIADGLPNKGEPGGS